MTRHARVLEIGPGSGYYSVAVAARVPEGSLTLCDVQPEMLEKSARRLEAHGLSNHTSVLSDGTGIPFEHGVSCSKHAHRHNEGA